MVAKSIITSVKPSIPFDLLRHFQNELLADRHPLETYRGQVSKAHCALHQLILLLKNDAAELDPICLSYLIEPYVDILTKVDQAMDSYMTFTKALDEKVAEVKHG